MNRYGPTTILVALALALASCSDCGGAEAPSIPETATGRLEAYAGALPARTESALFVADIPALTAGASSLKRQIGQFVPGTKLAARHVKTLVGVDLFAEWGWRDVGIGNDGGTAVATIDGHPVVLAHIEDRQAFERRLKRLAEHHYQLTDSVRLESAGDLQMKVLRRSGAQIAWTYRDRLALVVFPTLEIAPESGPTVTQTLRDLPLVGSSEALADTDGYRAMRRDTDSGTNFAYLRPRSVAPYLFDDGGLRAMAAGLALDLLLEPLTGLGAAIEEVSDRIRGSVWLGTRPNLAEAIGEVAAVEPAETWNDVTGDGVLLAVRASVDLEALRRHGFAALPDDLSRSWRRRLKRWSDRTGIDPDADLLAPATGRLLFAIHDVDRDFSLPAFASDPVGELGTIDAVAGIEFASEEAATAARDKLRDATDGETLFELPLTLRRMENRLLLVAEKSTVGEDTASANGPDLGSGVASLYVDGTAIAERFENRLSPGSLAAKLLDRFEGALATLSHRGDGLVLEGEVTLRDD